MVLRFRNRVRAFSSISNERFGLSSINMLRSCDEGVRIVLIGYAAYLKPAEKRVFHGERETFESGRETRRLKHGTWRVAKAPKIHRKSHQRDRR